jgi:CheY-like chemotaxis protein
VPDPIGAPSGLLLSDDLIFTSRIFGSAASHGLILVAARSAAELMEMAHRSPPQCVIVDLDNPGLDVQALMAEVSGLEPRPRVVAYGPHVNAELLRSARLAGCDPVLPRSQFVEQLETELPAWFR